MINIVTKTDSDFEIDIICKTLFLLKNINKNKIFINLCGDQKTLSKYVKKILQIYCKGMEIHFFTNKKINELYKKEFLNITFYDEKNLEKKIFKNINLDEFINKKIYNRKRQIEGIKYLYNELINL